MTEERFEELVFEYLDERYESGVLNTFGPGPFLPYIEIEFDLSREEARRFLIHWIETFSERHPLAS